MCIVRKNNTKKKPCMFFSAIVFVVFVAYVPLKIVIVSVICILTNPRSGDRIHPKTDKNPKAL